MKKIGLIAALTLGPALVSVVVTLGIRTAFAQTTLLNVSYDPTRELYKDFNAVNKIKLVSIDDTFGGWQKAQKAHFADGGTFDQIYLKK